jgi:hypothetical protein
MIIRFEKLDELMKNDPFRGDEWEDLDEKGKRRWHIWAVSALEIHPWCGKTVEHPIQTSAFPRIIGKSTLYWEDDPTAPVAGFYDHGPTIILPHQWIAAAVSNQMGVKELLELKDLRDLGIATNKVGPLETEFVGSVNGTIAKTDTPLPEPLWAMLGKYSTLNTATERRFLSLPIKRS